MYKKILMTAGILWSGGLLTAQTFKVVDLGSDRDFFLGVFGGCTTGMGLSKSVKNNDETPK